MKGKIKCRQEKNHLQTGGNSLVQKPDFKTSPQSVQSIHILKCYFSKSHFNIIFFFFRMQNNEISPVTIVW